MLCEPCRINKTITLNINNDIFLSYNYQMWHFKNNISCGGDEFFNYGGNFNYYMSKINISCSKIICSIC